MEEMEKEINALHAVLEARGINSKRTTDIFGRECAAALPPLPCCARVPRRGAAALTWLKHGGGEARAPTPLVLASRVAPATCRTRANALARGSVCASHAFGLTRARLLCLRFELPVNAEHKATTCNMRTICSVAQPHMRSTRLRATSRAASTTPLRP